MAKKRTERMDAAPRRNDREQMVEEAREQERKAVEKAIEIAVEIYGPAFEQLEKY